MCLCLSFGLVHAYAVAGSALGECVGLGRAGFVRELGDWAGEMDIVGAWMG